MTRNGGVHLPPRPEAAASRQQMAESAPSHVILRDTFEQDARRGDVIGGVTTSGHRRLGVDVERVMSVDNGALRIQPLLHAGWGRATLAYGPFDAQPGLALAVYMTNGHNTSQGERLPDSLPARLDRWLRGPETEGRGERLIRWLRSGRVLRTLRQFRWWYLLRRPVGKVPILDENLALGWSPASTGSPLDNGFGLVMHATGPENGEIWAGAAGHLSPVVRGVQNLPIHYFLVLRQGGGVIYASSVHNAFGLGAFPDMRPLQVVSGDLGDSLYATVHQSVLGQIGFRLDSRIHEVRTANLPGWDTWWAGAHAADRRNAGLSAGRAAEVGGVWTAATLQSYAYSEAEVGRQPAIVLGPDRPSGLVRTRIDADPSSSDRVLVLWRWQSTGDHWRFEAGQGKVRVVCLSDGEPRLVEEADLDTSGGGEVTILDDGRVISAFWNGTLAVPRIADSHHSDARGLGIGTSGNLVSSFEAHPRFVRIPTALDMGSPDLQPGSALVLADDFSTGPGDLHLRQVTAGVQWRKLVGSGEVVVDPVVGARVIATAANPSRGRTLHALPWNDADFADIEVTITPPGSARGQKENGRSGLVLWQDEDNYIVVNIWLNDGYGGASISCFFRIRGFEDIYDAIWTNVGSRVSWGNPLRLRLVCDGRRYMVMVDDEPVIIRALTDVYPDCAPLRIHQVGLATNWEWGEDTGSIFSHFRGRKRSA